MSIYGDNWWDSCIRNGDKITKKLMTFIITQITNIPKDLSNLIASYIPRSINNPASFFPELWNRQLPSSFKIDIYGVKVILQPNMRKHHKFLTLQNFIENNDLTFIRIKNCSCQFILDFKHLNVTIPSHDKHKNYLCHKLVMRPDTYCLGSDHEFVEFIFDENTYFNI